MTTHSYMNPLVDKSEYAISEFDAWSWMTKGNGTPISLTVFGDWIYSSDNGIYLCSPTCSENYEIATVVEEIDWALEDVNERAPWLFPPLLHELEKDGVIRERGKVFHFVQPLFLGGRVAKANIEQLNIPLYFQGMLGLLRELR